MKRFETKYFNGYDIEPKPDGSVALEALYIDEDGYDCYVELDAIEVYTNLKRYFKGTEYE